MSESDIEDVEVEFKSDDEDAESVGSGSNVDTDETGSKNESVYFSDDDDDGNDDDNDDGNDDDNDDGNDDVEEPGSPKPKDNDDDDGDDDDDGYDSDDDDDDNLQKFDHETKKKYIESHHPECLSFNHEETETLSRVVRDENGRIVDPYHKTLPFLTKYEKTRILGIRTKQLNEGAKPYIDVNSTIIDGYIIAQLELEHKRLPFIIRRPIPNGGSELWKLQDLEIIC